eukprot:2242141-Pleurochrysis_carterae.AAC.1
MAQRHSFNIMARGAGRAPGNEMTPSSRRARDARGTDDSDAISMFGKSIPSERICYVLGRAGNLYERLLFQ